MEQDMTWLAELGIDRLEGVGYTGSRDKYIRALKQFSKSHEGNRAKADTFFKEKDLENYRIIVHSLKSNAKMIGAQSLSDAFKELEMAARDGDSETIESKHAQTIQAYDKLVAGLMPLCDGDAESVPSLTGSEAKETAVQLMGALDDFDDEGSLELVKKLSGYSFQTKEKEMVDKARAYIEDFLYDEAASVIREVIPSIG